MAISIWHLLISLWLLFLCVQANSTYEFRLVSTGEHLLYLKLYPDVRSTIECGRLCGEKRKDDGIQRMCEAFNFNTMETGCQLYSAKVNSTDASGVPVYRFTILDEDPSDGFEYITTGGETFVYHVTDAWYTYENARTHCLSLNAYLLHMDTVAEFDAILQLLDMKGITGNAKLFIGANDLNNEGDWVCERHNRTLDFTTWVFKAHNPNDYGSTGEDCAAFQLKERLLNDVPCGATFPALCERSP